MITKNEQLGTTVHSVADPKVPGRTVYEIAGPNEVSVTYAIGHIRDGETVDAGEFTTPRKTPAGLWVAIGWTIERKQEERA